MNGTLLTEAEFRVFIERLDTFARRLAPNERLFLMIILARASVARSLDLQGYGLYPESAICGELAFSIWQSTVTPEQFIAPNPQPIPPGTPVLGDT